MSFKFLNNNNFYTKNNMNILKKILVEDLYKTNLEKKFISDNDEEKILKKRKLLRKLIMN